MLGVGHSRNIFPIKICMHKYHNILYFLIEGSPNVNSSKVKTTGFQFRHEIPTFVYVQTQERSLVKPMLLLVYTWM